MASLRAKLGRIVVRKFYNMNPEGGKSFAEVTEMVSNYGTKVRKGFVRTVERTEEGVVFERVAPVSGGNGKLVLYMHGGGYSAGLSQAYRTQACDMAKAAGGAECIMPDYDLSPEHKYPTQHEQGYAMWLDVLRQGYQPKDIILGGDSAGGNLALSVMLRLRDEGKELPHALFLISPWTDMAGSGASYETNYAVDPMFGKKNVVLDEESKERLLHSDMYAWVGDADRHDPYVSPVFGSYEGFPSTLMTVGGDEILLDDTLTIADSMRKAGVDVTVISHEKMFHIYPLYYTLFPESKKAYKQILSFIKDKLN